MFLILHLKHLIELYSVRYKSCLTPVKKKLEKNLCSNIHSAL